MHYNQLAGMEAAQADRKGAGRALALLLGLSVLTLPTLSGMFSNVRNKAKTGLTGLNGGILAVEGVQDAAGGPAVQARFVPRQGKIDDVVAAPPGPLQLPFFQPSGQSTELLVFWYGSTPLPANMLAGATHEAACVYGAHLSRRYALSTGNTFSLALPTGHEKDAVSGYLYRWTTQSEEKLRSIDRFLHFDPLWVPLIDMQQEVGKIEMGKDGKTAEGYQDFSKGYGISSLSNKDVDGHGQDNSKTRYFTLRRDRVNVVTQTGEVKQALWYFTDPAERLPAEVLETPRFHSTFRVQLFPDIPDTHPSVSLILQAGPFRAWMLRVRNWRTPHSDSVPNARMVKERLKYWLDRAEGRAVGAVYVCMPEALLENSAITLLKQRGYNFFAFNKLTGEIVYYHWTNPNRPDRVPAYATSIEGGGMILISPDDSKALVVKEHGRWTFPGGSTDSNETTLECAIRECFEEAGAKPDPHSKIYMMGGWNVAGSRELYVNDHYNIYLTHAASESYKADGDEILEAQWISVGLLLDALQHGKQHPKSPRIIVHKEVYYNAMLLHAIKRWKTGQGFVVFMQDHGRPKMGVEFH
eukprot:g31772.t1